MDPGGIRAVPEAVLNWMVELEMRGGEGITLVVGYQWCLSGWATLVLVVLELPEDLDRIPANSLFHQALLIASEEIVVL